MTTSTDAGPVKKHRHDLGQEDHGPVMAAGTTRAVQILLGLWIALTAIAVVWAMTEAGRGPAHARPASQPTSSPSPR